MNNEILNSRIKDLEYTLEMLLVYINGVTVYHRHGADIPAEKLDKLSNYQIEVEKKLTPVGNSTE